MDWLSVGLAGAGGTIGGAIGAAIGTAFKDPSRKLWRTALLVAPTVFLGQFGASLAKSQKVRDLFTPPSRLELHLRPYVNGFIDSPAMKARLAALPPDQQPHAAHIWTHAGLKQLDPADLEKWNAIRLEMAKRSKPVCAGFWTGKLDSALFVKAVEQLPDADLDSWARLSMTAMKRAIESPDAPVAADAIGNALRRIGENVPATDSARFQQDLRAGPGIADDEACWAFTTLARAAATLEAAPREAVLRALASL